MSLFGVILKKNNLYKYCSLDVLEQSVLSEKKFVSFKTIFLYVLEAVKENMRCLSLSMSLPFLILPLAPILNGCSLMVIFITD